VQFGNLDDIKSAQQKLDKLINLICIQHTYSLIKNNIHKGINRLVTGKKCKALKMNLKIL
tara:strand:+ start:118 stop:297 length:180 start_codon:yes stop_codon:yes gene_type:complete